MGDSMTCLVKGIHTEVVSRVRNRIPDDDRLQALASFFKLFGDGTRIGILWALSEAEMCVCDICALLRMKQPAVSHQLKNLKQARIVRSRRDGKVIYYALDDDHIRKLLNQGLAHVQETGSPSGDE